MLDIKSLSVVSALMLAFALPSNLAHAQSKILNYDKSGRATDSQELDQAPLPPGNNDVGTGGAPSGSSPSTFDPDKEFEPGEVVVADPPDNFSVRAKARGFRILEVSRLGNLGLELVRVGTPPGMSVKQAIRVLASEFPGITISANHRFDPSAAGGARNASNPRAIAGWAGLSATCGKGLVLGMIDSGVDTSHPALAGQDIQYKAFTKSGRQPGPPDHGTSVAAMLVGKAEWGGLVPGAKLYAANMFEINEDGRKVGSAVGLIKAIDWLAGLNVHAVNMSVAGGDNKVVRKALDIAKRGNLLLVASVGNWGRSDKPAYPAAYSDVVAVTALKGKDLIYSQANTGDYVDFAAPGVGIYTALPGGGGKPQSGTSFATPYITVMAAVLNRAGSATTAQKLRSLLTRATQDLGKPGKDNVFGYGFVKARPSCK